MTTLQTEIARSYELLKKFDAEIARTTVRTRMFPLQDPSGCPECVTVGCIRCNGMASKAGYDAYLKASKG